MTKPSQSKSRGTGPLIIVWETERRRVRNDESIEGRQWGKDFWQNESVGLDSDVGRRRLSDKNAKVVAAIDLAAIDRYCVVQ